MVSGVVLGPGRDAVGRSIEVRALGGTATTAGAADMWFQVIAMATTMIALVGLSALGLAPQKLTLARRPTAGFRSGSGEFFA
ncbi:hypothetical protein ACLQ2P_27450 [Actinomadura citrea]|uniref:hypothetical protein n=1 Tax=Actinomadura citrea TaxID=46158 RepID=UPI003CE4A998